MVLPTLGLPARATVISWVACEVGAEVESDAEAGGEAGEVMANYLKRSAVAG